MSSAGRNGVEPFFFREFFLCNSLITDFLAIYLGMISALDIFISSSNVGVSERSKKLNFDISGSYGILILSVDLFVCVITPSGRPCVSHSEKVGGC